MQVLKKSNLFERIKLNKKEKIKEKIDEKEIKNHK